MEKLYYKDQYIKDFTAELEDIREKDNKFHLVLDKTAFFPGAEGQVCDLGYIENEKVIDVYAEDGLIYHVVEKKPIKIHKLRCSIDWERRKNSMDQGLSYYILAACLNEEFNFNVLEFNIEKNKSTIDIEGILDEEKIRKLEKVTNSMIQEGLTVETLTPDKKELKKMKIKSIPNSKDEVRVLKIGDLNTTLSNGIYSNSTLEISMIKIIKWEKFKAKTRIEYIVGKAAIEDSFNKDKFVRDMCKYLNSTQDDAIEGIKDLNDKLKETLDKNRNMIEELSNYQVEEMIEGGEKVGDTTIVRRIYNNEDIKYVNRIGTKIVENNKTIALLGSNVDDKVNLIFLSSKDFKGISMNDLLKDSITLIDGKGGGSSHQAQGAGKNNSNLDSTLDYAINKVKQKR